MVVYACNPLGRMRWEDCELEDSTGYIVKPCLSKQNEKNPKTNKIGNGMGKN
jgi:hypothetical protein